VAAVPFLQMLAQI